MGGLYPLLGAHVCEILSGSQVMLADHPEGRRGGGCLWKAGCAAVWKLGAAVHAHPTLHPARDPHWPSSFCGVCIPGCVAWLFRATRGEFHQGVLQPLSLAGRGGSFRFPQALGTRVLWQVAWVLCDRVSHLLHEQPYFGLLYTLPLFSCQFAASFTISVV